MSKKLRVASPGWRELAVQVPDIHLKPNAPAFIPIELKTIELNNASNDGGLLAMSTVSGVGIVSAYGVTPPITAPPNTWAPIGIAGAYIAGTQPWRGHHGGAGASIQKFAITYDGTAPNGVQGHIQIAVNEGGDEFVPRIIGAINLYVRASAKPTWLRVIAASTTISGSRLILNHPYLNGNPDAKLFVTHVHHSPGSAKKFWNHPISVAYRPQLARWTIQNDDAARMVAGLAFNVRIDPSAAVVFGPDWRKVSGNLHCFPIAHIPPITSIAINHPSATNNPYATIIVTPRGPDPTPLAVKYDAPTWYIVHVDGSPIPACGIYNVQVIGFSEYFDVSQLSKNSGWLDPFVSNSSGITIAGDNSIDGPRNLPFWWQLGNPDEPIIITQNLTPPAVLLPTPVANHSYVGVSYSTGSNPTWQIINEDGSPVPNKASFNAWGQPQLTP